MKRRKSRKSAWIRPSLRRRRRPRASLRICARPASSTWDRTWESRRGPLDRGPQRGAALLFVAHVGIGEAGIRRDDLDQTVRGIARQRHLVDAFPDSNPFLGGFEPRALFRQVRAAALRGLGLLMYQARPEVHHRIFAGRHRGTPQSGAWLVLVHSSLLTE